MSRKTFIVLATSTVGLVIGAALLITLLRAYPVYVQSTHDMSPTILKDARMVVRPIGRKEPLRHGDLVVFESPQLPGELYVKRVAGLPGDTVEIRGGVLHRNGGPVDEPYATYEILEGFPERFRRLGERHDHIKSLVVPEDSVFLLGDNRSVSADSRMFGPAPRSAVHGKVVSINNP